MNFINKLGAKAAKHFQLTAPEAKLEQFTTHESQQILVDSLRKLSKSQLEVISAIDSMGGGATPDERTFHRTASSFFNSVADVVESRNSKHPQKDGPAIEILKPLNAKQFENIVREVFNDKNDNGLSYKGKFENVAHVSAKDVSELSDSFKKQLSEVFISALSNAKTQEAQTSQHAI